VIDPLPSVKVRSNFSFFLPLLRTVPLLKGTFRPPQWALWGSIRSCLALFPEFSSPQSFPCPSSQLVFQNGSAVRDTYCHSWSAPSGLDNKSRLFPPFGYWFCSESQEELRCHNLPGEFYFPFSPERPGVGFLEGIMYFFFSVFYGNFLL